MPKNRNGEDVVVPPKDDEELYLEKLVFGDADGFEKNLKKTDNLFDYSSDEEDDGSSDKFFHDASSNSSEDEDDLENVQDDDLFFIDDGQKQSENEDEDEDMDVDVQYDEEEEDVSDEEANAWEDSDDEKLNVSLIASDKLKKLRKTTHDTSCLLYTSRCV